MTFTILLAGVALYIAGTTVMASRAFRYLKNPRRQHDFLDLYRPEHFTAEGQRARVAALRFAWLMCVALALFVIGTAVR